MAELPTIPRVDDPLAALRRSVGNHAKATQANIDAGKQQPPPPAPAPAPTEGTA